jgi:thiol-disulfide isomerase/thioredoxin
MTSRAGDAQGVASEASPRRRALQIALPLVVIAAVVAIVVLLPRGTSGATPPAYSTATSAWVLPKLNGSGTVELASLRGRPVVVNFFASWCTPCRTELPEFLSVSQRAGGRIAFVGVDSEENGDGLALARNSGITAWPLARDVGGSQLSGLRDSLEATPGMPVTAFYDAGGRLLSVRLGAIGGDQLSTMLNQLFGVRLS